MSITPPPPPIGQPTSGGQFIDMNDPRTWPKPDGGAAFQTTNYAEEAAKRAEEVAAARAEAPLPKRAGQALTVHVTGRMKQLIEGTISVDDLDDEELQRGQVKDQNGRFTGSKSDMVPRKLHDEMMRRILKRGAEKWRTDYFAAIDAVVGIMKDEDLDANIRLKAADMVLNRVAGKAIEKVELSVEVKPWEHMLTGIAKSVPPELMEQVEYAEVVDDEPV